MSMFKNNNYVPYYGRGAEVGQYQPSPMIIQQPLPQNQMKGRPVASIDEAKAAQIDLDGSLSIFPNVNNKEIYTKQLNLDGTVSFTIFVPAPAAPEVEPQSYITKTELNDILAEFKKSLSPAFNL